MAASVGVRSLGCVFCLVAAVHCLTDITHRAFDRNLNGILSAFGDFNADKLTDMFLITGEGRSVEVYLAREAEPLLTKSKIRCDFTTKDGNITSIVPGDYDGDSRMDLLITFQAIDLQKQNNHLTQFRILWGTLDSLNCSSTISGSMTGQPLVLDYNADKIPDLYGESANGTRQVWIMRPNKSFEIEVVPVTNSSIRHPHSNAFLDLNGDMAADVFVTTEKGFEMWYNVDGSFRSPVVTSLTGLEEAKIIGQSVFLDVDVDGFLDHLLPVCYDEACTNCTIYIHRKKHNSAWIPIGGPFQYNNRKWGFVHDSQFPITLRVGDANLDGYPDLVAVMNSSHSGDEKQRAFLLENKPCSGCQFHRQFTLSSMIGSDSAITKPYLVTFYDILQDGNLDFLVGGKDSTNTWTVAAILNENNNDVSFIKIFVLSGLCYSDCPYGHKPFGVNQPGPFIRYRTVRPDGTPQVSCAAQLPQSAHFALYLPYTVFGLGQTPNFVDDLTVGVPRSSDKKAHTHSWPSIIPNSQMIVIPLEYSTSDYRWVNKLFVTPSHQVVLTCVALSATCAFLIFVIGGLHWKEKIADKKEKLQEAHRFHFDAM